MTESGCRPKRKREAVPVREARPREPKTATVERREASVPRHGTQGASQAPGVPRYVHAQRVPRKHPNVSRCSAHPSMRGERSKVANPGRKNAPRERDGLFDIVSCEVRDPRPHPEERAL